MKEKETKQNLPEKGTYETPTAIPLNGIMKAQGPQQACTGGSNVVG